MTPKDWRHPKHLYTLEHNVDGEWRQSDLVSPFREVVEDRCALAFDPKKVRLVTYRREVVERRKFWERRRVE